VFVGNCNCTFSKHTFYYVLTLTEQWDEFPSAEDWDNEEYTGSLAESKVFTASTLPQTAAGVNSAPTDTVTGGPANLQTETPSNGFGGSNHIGGECD